MESPTDALGVAGLLGGDVIMALLTHATKRRVAWIGSIAIAAAAGCWYGREHSGGDEQDVPTCAPHRSTVSAEGVSGPTDGGFRGGGGPPSPPAAGAAAIQQQPTVAARISELSTDQERNLVRELNEKKMVDR